MERRTATSIVLCVVAVIGLVLAVAACGDDKPEPAKTVTVTASGSPTTDGSPSPSPKPTAAKVQSVIAVAAGPKANALAAVVPTTKTSTTLVAAKGGAITEIAWSPDGARIAYSQLKSASSGDTAVWVYDVAKRKVSAARVSGAVPKSVAGFTWLSPTKLLVADMVGGASVTSNGQLHVCDVANGTSSPLEDDTSAVVRGVWPTAAAGGATVAFARYGKVTGSTQPESLVVYRADTRKLTKAAHGKRSTDIDNDLYTFPRISPDGTLIYACSTGSDPGFSFTVHKAGGGHAYKSPGLVWPMRAAWDAGSGRLAYGAAKGGDWQRGALWTWVPGSTSTNLVTKTKKKMVFGASWSPDGGSIAYEARSTTAANGDLWVVGATGADPHLVLTKAGAPAWAEAAVPGL